jgi:mono/diheme cytochrome c family protein
MKFKYLLSFLLLVGSLSPAVVDAQRDNSSTGPALTPVQAQGAKVFKQRCGLCHLLYIVGTVNGQTAVMKGKMIGPMLSKNMITGAEDAVRQQIMNGGERMPGFQYALTPTQITSIIEYLKTVDRPTEIGNSTGSGDEDN